MMARSEIDYEVRLADHRHNVERVNRNAWQLEALREKGARQGFIAWLRRR
jgi:hypothetical protein